MTQTKDLIKKMADFFAGEEFYEKGEDARLELSPDDVRCMNYLIQQRNKELEQEPFERCGKCKYAEVADPEDRQDGYTCQYHRGSIWFSGSFCSWAERRGKE